MTWDDYYDKFYGWSDSTQISRISQLSSFGSHEEVYEIAQMISDEKAASRLVKKALDYGVKFTVNEIIDLQLYVTKACMNELVKKCSYPFSQEQVEELVFSIDDDLYAALEKKYCNSNLEDTDDYEGLEKDLSQKERKPSRFFGALAFAGMLLETSNQEKSPHFRIGDHIRVRYRGQEGTIIDINNGMYMVSLSDGKFIDSYPESALEKAW